MLPYYIIFLISLFFFSIPHFKYSGKMFSPSVFYILSATALSIFSAFRSLEGGGDIFSYLYTFQNIGAQISNQLEGNLFFNEIGYQYLNLVIHFLSDSNEFFLFSISAIILFFTYKGILKSSSYPVLSFICFILLNFYNFHFNGVRQAITISIAVYSLKYIFNRSFLKFLIVVGFGFLIHKNLSYVKKVKR